jgi:DoxX-like family
MIRKWFPLLGLGFAIAGADKLLGLGIYEQMFAKWGWSDGARQLVGAGEFAGGVLVASERGRHLGGWLLTATSAAMLSAEIDRHERDLALPRFVVMLAAVTSLLPGWGRR